MMDNVMIDLETLGTRPYSAILAIGAVMFDPYSIALGTEFYATISLESCLDSGLVVDAKTIEWWMTHKTLTDDAKEVFKGQRQLHEVLLDFNLWLGTVSDNSSVKVWGNGSDFDNILLGCAYGKSGVKIPWHFRNNRCYRTIKSLFGADLKPSGTSTRHHALHDAIAQAQLLMDIWPKSPLQEISI